MKYLLFLTLALALNSGCQSVGIDRQNGSCGNGEADVADGVTYCIFTGPLIIDGFRCPPDYPELDRFTSFNICSQQGNPPNDLIERWRERVNMTPFVDDPGPPIVDILFVIDNSGSMCQEQQNLAAGFPLFLDALPEGASVQIGVTTTHMFEDFAPEPVALPGHLQSTPQPVPGNDRTCKNAVDNNGQIIAGDWSPIRQAIAVAVSCMETPDDSFDALSDADIACALDGVPANCSIADRCDSNCTAFDIFPTEDQYRSLPKVLKTANYRDDEGVLDIDTMTRDFACMSLVGTRGYGIEKGLGALVAATSPELVGGTDNDPVDESAPNFGLLRSGASFSVYFVTDENDCSHDGSLDETTTCLDSVCEYAQLTGGLTSIEEIRSELLANLSENKGSEVGERSVIAGGAYGPNEPFTGEPRTGEQCSMGDTGVVEACATLNGIAFSGSRYAEFVQSFTNEVVGGSGAICEDSTPFLVAYGEQFEL